MPTIGPPALIEPVRPFIETVNRGAKQGLRFNFHPGQLRAMNSRKRSVLVLAGTRGGKSSMAVIWLYREMRRRGPGDYLVAAPNYTLLDKAIVPDMEYLFCTLMNLGRMRHSPLEFRFSEEGAYKLFGQNLTRPSRVLFGHADEPNSLEAMTAKAAVLDEAGQPRFKMGSWEAIQRRLSLHEGRSLIVTTPYCLNWIKTLLYDPLMTENKNHPEIDVVNFDSLENPAFPKEEYERARRNLPGWKFNMFYRGLFDRPAGIIYDSFDRVYHTCPRFTIPAHWPRYRDFPESPCL